MKKQRKFTDKELDDLYIKSLHGDKKARNILRQEYRGFINRMGLHVVYSITDAENIMRRKLKHEPSKNQLKVVAGVKQLHNYKRVKYDDKVIIFETDIKGRFRKKISEIKIGR